MARQRDNGPPTGNLRMKREPEVACYRTPRSGLRPSSCLFDGILASVLASVDAADDIDWTVSVDSTVVRAHQHAAGALERGRRDAGS